MFPKRAGSIHKEWLLAATSFPKVVETEWFCLAIGKRVASDIKGELRDGKVNEISLDFVLVGRGVVIG
jgi:hypothetical protein